VFDGEIGGDPGARDDEGFQRDLSVLMQGERCDGEDGRERVWAGVLEEHHGGPDARADDVGEEKDREHGVFVNGVLGAELVKAEENAATRLATTQCIEGGEVCGAKLASTRESSKRGNVDSWRLPQWRFISQASRN